MYNAVQLLKHYCNLPISQLQLQLNHIDDAFLSDERALRGTGARVHRVFAMGPIAGDYTNVGWVVNSDAPSCMICGTEFGVLVGIHHCRGCGNAICDACSQDRAVVEELRALGPQRLCRMCYWGQESVRTKPLISPNTIAIVERAIEFCDNERKHGQLNGFLRRMRGKNYNTTNGSFSTSRSSYTVPRGGNREPRESSMASSDSISQRGTSSIVHTITPTEELIRQARLLAEEEAKQRLNEEALRRAVEEEQAQRSQRESQRLRDHIALVEAEKQRLSMFEEAVLSSSVHSDSSIIRALRPAEEKEMRAFRASQQDAEALGAAAAGGSYY